MITMKSHALTLALAGLTLTTACEPIDDPSLEHHEQALTGGSPSGEIANYNAILRITNTYYGVACTGTLVAPDVILTSGHCVMGRNAPDGTPVPDALYDGGWHQLPEGHFSVRIGTDRDNPVEVIETTWFSSPPLTASGGHDDIALIGLDAPIPANVATPRAIQFTVPANLDRVYAYGATPRQRLRSYAGGRDVQMEGPNYFRFTLDRDAATEPGDSGGPVFLGSVAGPLVGVIQQAGRRSGAVAAFGRGNRDKPDLSDWLQRNVRRGHCSRTQSGESVGDGGAHTQLFSWWSAARTDNLTAVGPAWTGCRKGDVEIAHGGYGFFQSEGWILHPLRPRPTGAHALYLWWNARTRNHATTTLAKRPDAEWDFVQTLGYVYSTPAADRVALRQWYSAARNDYLTTSDGKDYRAHGYVDIGIIGYAVDPDHAL